MLETSPLTSEDSATKSFLSTARHFLLKAHFWAVPAVTLLAALAFFLAWQFRPIYKIDFGERLDRPFLQNFNTREPGEDFRLNPKNEWDGTSYRWSKGVSQVELPGIGAQPLTVTLRLTRSAQPTPTLEILAHGKLLAQPPIALEGWQEYQVLIPVEQVADGNLKLTLKSTPFNPPGDPRQLGLAYDWLRVESAPDASRFVLPPAKTYFSLVLAILLLATTFWRFGLPGHWLMVAGSVITGGLVYWLVADRLSLTLFLEQNVLLTFGLVCAAAVLLAQFAPPVYARMGLSISRSTSSWLAFFFLAFFVSLWGVQLHPQFESSDVGLAYRHMLSVSKGDLVLAEPLPNGQLSPYAPAFYLLLQPFMWVSGTDRAAVGNLVTFANSLFAASGVFLVFYLAGQLFKKTDIAPLAGLLAVAFYSINRYPYYIFSQGNHANLFGAWAFLLFLCLLVWTFSQPDFLVKAKRPNWVAWLPFGGLLFTLLTHYGTFLFANVFVIAYALGLLILGGKQGWKVAVYVGGGWLLTFIIAFALYYREHFQLITAPFRGEAGVSVSEKGPFEVAGFFRALYASNRENFGLLVVFCGLGGLLLLNLLFWQIRFGKTAAVSAPAFNNLFLLQLALLATGVAFAFAEVAQGLESRYQLYIIAPMTLFAGYFLARLWRTSFVGIGLVVALFALQFLQTLLFWLERISYYGFNGL